MKTIGLIGGMSWESTITYYEILNKEIAKALGGFHSAKIMMYNVDFAELEANLSSGNWDGNAKILTDAAKRLEGAGADFIVIATNTMHKLVPQVEKEIRIPILHIADATHQARQRQKSRPPRHQIHDDAGLHQEPPLGRRSRSYDTRRPGYRTRKRRHFQRTLPRESS